jgi:hypothetical protein
MAYKDLIPLHPYPLGVYLGLFPLPGDMGVYGFPPPGPLGPPFLGGIVPFPSPPCLDGKASEYYALLVERNHDMAYKDLILKLEKRFGFRELLETAQVQFNNARQTPEELLED